MTPEEQQAPADGGQVNEVIKAFIQLSALDKKAMTAFGLGLLAGLHLAKQSA
jgi:hypothetical protein